MSFPVNGSFMAENPTQKSLKRIRIHWYTKPKVQSWNYIPMGLDPASQYHPPSSFILGSWHPSIKRAQKGDSSEVSSYSFCPPQFENQYSYLLHVYWAASLCQALCGCWDTMLSRSALQQYWLCSQTHCAMSYLLVFECVVRFFLNCPFCQDHRGNSHLSLRNNLDRDYFLKLSSALLPAITSTHCTPKAP